MLSNPVAVVEAFHAALDRGDADAALALLSDGFVLVQADLLPYGGTWRGHEGMRAYLGRLGESWAQFSMGTPHCVSDGQRTVVALSTATGETQGGAPFEMPMAQVYAVEEGRLTAAHPFYFDTAAVLRALGS